MCTYGSLEAKRRRPNSRIHRYLLVHGHGHCMQTHGHGHRHTDTQTLQEATPECSECNVSHLTDIHSSSHQSVNCWILTLSAVGTFSLRVLIGLPVFLIHISINDAMHYYNYTSFSHLPCTVQPLWFTCSRFKLVPSKQSAKCGRGDHHQDSFIVLVFMNSSSSSAPPSSSYWSAVRRAEGWRRPCRECGLYNRDHQITPRFKRLAHTPSKACDGAADDEANIEQVGAKHDTVYWSPHSYNCYNLWCVWRLIWQRAAEAQNVKVKCKV